MPGLLLVPVSGPTGSGELRRAMVLADASQRRWPALPVAIAVSRSAPDAGRVGHDVVLLDDSPTRSTPAIIASLRARRPALVIFDGAARVAQLAAAAALGTRAVFVSSRPSGRAKAFRVRRLRRLDEIWFTQPAFLEPDLNAVERWKRRLIPRARVRRIGPIFDAGSDDRRRTTLARWSASPGRYVLLCPGLAAVSESGRHAADAISGAAPLVGPLAGLRCIVVGGREARPRPEGVRWIEALPNYELMDLLDGAAVAVTTGGSLLLQSLALGTPTVALPASRDQPGRIARCVAGGLALTCAPEADAVARCVSALAADQGRLLQLRSALAASEMAGGLERAMGAIESLLAS